MTLPVEAPPATPEALARQADTLHRTGNLAAAEQLYERILQIDPGHAEALQRLATIHLSTSRTASGVSLLRRLVAVRPDLPIAFANLGAGLLLLDQYAEAIVCYDRAIELLPSFAEAHSNRGAAFAKLRRYLEALAAFDQAVAHKPDFADAYANRGNTLCELGRYDDALASFDRAIAINPRFAMAHAGRGIALDRLDRPDSALVSLDSALRLDPRNVEVHVRRGRGLARIKRFDDAIASYDRAIALRHDHAEAHFHRGVALSRLARHEQAIVSYDLATALAPRNADAFSNRGVMLGQLGQFDAALASYDAALAIEPDRPDTQFNQSITRLMLGQFDTGWPQFESRKRQAGHSIYHDFNRPPWTGQGDIAGKRLFVYWEQGFGDTIQFCRYAKLVRDAGAEVILFVQDSLVTLIRTLDPAIRVAGTADGTQTFDLDTPMMSLPLAFGTRLGTIPAAQSYLSADPALQAGWEARLDPGPAPRIGLVWRGSATHPNDRNRSIEPEALLPLLTPACNWVCLQKEARPADLAILRIGAEVAFFGDELGDFADTAALVAAMDLVITVDTSIAHLAGALGKPVWILLPWVPDWRWLLDRADSPWYPSARLFRQPALGDWGSVVDDVGRGLAAWRAQRATR